MPAHLMMICHLPALLIFFFIIKSCISEFSKKVEKTEVVGTFIKTKDFFSSLMFQTQTLRSWRMCLDLMDK